MEEDEEYLLMDEDISSQTKLKRKIYQGITVFVVLGIIVSFLAGVIIYQIYFDLKNQQKSIHFIVFGDYGNYGRGNQKLVAERIGSFCKTHVCEFIVTTGDNFYPNGTTSVYDEHWKKSFLETYNDDTIKDLPFYAVLGNHDYKTHPQSQVDYHYHSNASRWYMPSRYYNVSFSKQYEDRSLNVQFLMLDSTPLVNY
jgi:tartrate-resistant acid phosphatase type 5